MEQIDKCFGREKPKKAVFCV